ncbi:mechanosensitive ion channel family protein [Aeromicrobium sp.]|nr:mechanosensitive ion channel family protein [Candidatus Saccharibacteria bacterium]
MYFTQFAVSEVDKTLNQSTSTLRHISESLFASGSILVLVIALIIGSVVGKLLSLVLRRLSRGVARGADASTNLTTVNRLRRFETWIILSVAIVRFLSIILALYFWWIFVHPNGQPTALVGASAVLIIVVGGVVGPLLRDFSFGSGMMAEHWFGVGDLVTVEPFSLRGVVERVTLRSTRIRGLNGEIIWVSNQNIASVSIAQKGVWTIAVELFVNDKAKAEKMLARVNDLLPNGPSLVVRPLALMGEAKGAQGLWHITAIAETAPGREWLIERTAIDLIKSIDEKATKPVLVSEPIARFADNDTEREFARAVRNAKKSRPTKRKLVKLKP